MKVTVIGGGPAGMMAAISAAGTGDEVTLLEKNDRLGKKLFLTGGGRCNLCYAADQEELLRHVIGNPSFLYSAFYAFGSDALMEFFEKRGVALKNENGRVFPKSDKASDIIEALEAELKKRLVDVRLNYAVTDVRRLKSECDALIIATGGKSYPATGSTGDGYEWARGFGHTIVNVQPALTPLRVRETWVADLAGLSLEAGLTCGKYFSGVGELLFTHRGVSGPIVMEASRYLCGHFDTRPEIKIDLMPHLDEAQLDKLLLQAFESSPNKSLGNIIGTLLPKSLIPHLLESADKRANTFTKQERAALAQAIKGITLTVAGNPGFREAVITVGGVDTREVNPSTMESKLTPGLYFAGEVIDVDALSGGFNLQIAFSTGYLAGIGRK